ncbi:MAG: hypothetical protein U0R70_09180 [Solirubrobacteraceae bacterium]
MASKFDTDPARNYAFPDSGAVYWNASVIMPAGSTIVLKGRFAHARYQSLNVYNVATHGPVDALNDVSTKPDRGSTNPFLPGARRDAVRRSYTVTMRNEPVPSGTRAPNTLYAGVAGQERQVLALRVYVPDSFKQRELTGGVGLPVPELHLADGSVQTGQAACNTLQATQGPPPLTTLPGAQYALLRSPPGAAPTFPSAATPVFRAFYNTAYSITCGFQGICPANPARIGGQYSNIDNTYISAFVNRGFPAGPVLVLTGKLPTTPRTGTGTRTMGRGQLRYWSICQNESVFTTKGAGCVYDVQVPVDRHRNYTIVSSLAADRPKNATAKCGVAFVPWPKNGDGAGHRNDGFLIVRNMLPAPSFKQAIQRTVRPGDEAAVMGPYLPKGSYTTKAKFERRGC